MSRQRSSKPKTFEDLPLDSGDASPLDYSNLFYSHQETSYRGFLDEALNPTSQNPSSGFAEPDFNGFLDQMAGEEFFDAAEVLNGKHDMYGMKFATNLDLDKSGIRDDAHIRRTDSMSPSDCDRVSVNRYFLRRSAYSSEQPQNANVDPLDFLARSGNKVSCPSSSSRLYPTKKFGRDFDGQEVEHRRSTLTRHDLLDIIDSNDANRVRKQKGPSSVCSTDSSVRSSIGTVAALEELDRILQDVSSDEGSRHSPIPPGSNNSEHMPSNPPRQSAQKNSSFQKQPPTAVPKSTNYASPSGLLATQSRLCTHQPEEKPTGSGGFQKSFEIKSKAVQMLDNLLDVPPPVRPARPAVAAKPALRGWNDRVQERLPDRPRPTGANDTIMLDNKTEEILRRANNVLARVERMKNGDAPDGLSKSLPVPQLRSPVEDQQQSTKRPRIPATTLTTEPESAAQGKYVPSRHSQPTTRHTQTDTDELHMSAMDTTHDQSLLEQTTYPVARSSEDVRDIVLATHRIFFPPTEVGESSMAKLQIKNYTARPAQLRFFLTNKSSVFSCRYDNLNIQPRRFMNLPVRFLPSTTGYFETKIRLTVDGPLHKEMIVDVVGEGIARVTSNY